MSQALARFLFESSPWGPLETALLAGFAAIDWWGTVYLTEAGAAYLEEIGA